MRVLVVGGNGLIGSYVVARLHADGHDIVALGRNLDAARVRMPWVRWVRADLRRLRTPADWTAVVDGVEALVNCAGALQDSPQDDLAAVHVESATALYAACERAGVHRAVLISAAGVAPGRATRFNDTKLEGEAALRRTGLEWLILRPGLVLAPAAYGGTALLRGLAGAPGVVALAYPASPVQVVSIDDVAGAVAIALLPTTPPGRTFDLVSPEVTSLQQIVLALRAWLGLKPAPVVAAPVGLARVAGGIADALAVLGWRSPMRTTSIAQLAAGVTGDSSSTKAGLGFEVRRLDALLAAWPSGVQERWFARLYFAKPAAIAVLAAFWAASGLIGLTAGFRGAILALPPQLPHGAAVALVTAGSIVDLAIGAGIAVRRTTMTALQGALLVSAAYLIAGTVLRPDLWRDPFGPLLKILPAALLTLMTMAIMGDR